MLSRAEKWAVAAIGAFLGTSIVELVRTLLGTCPVPLFTRDGGIKFLLSWAVSTLICRVFVIWLPDKIRNKNAKRRAHLQ